MRRARDSIRTPAGVCSLAVATLHRSVALCRSSFESLSFGNIKRVKQLSLLYPLNLAESKGFDSRDCGRLVARGHNSPPDCCSVPLVLRIPFFYNTKRVKQLRYFTLLIWRRARDSTRTPAGVWSLAVATLHRSVALCRSSFESLSFGNIKRVKQLSLLYPLNLAESKGFEPSNR